MFYKYYTLVFCLIVLFNCFISNGSDEKLFRELLRTKISEITTQTTKLCNFPAEIKLAICDYVIGTVEINLNRTAYSLLNLNCVIKSVVLNEYEDDDANSLSLYMYMMPCYTRNNPMRTSWLDDNDFNYIYLSGGPDDSSWILFERVLQITNDVYSPSELIEDLFPSDLFPVEINQNDLIEELKLPETVTCNNMPFDIQVMYLRERKKSKLEEYDPVCNLKTDYKILLCHIIFTYSSLFNDWTLNAAAFSNDSSQCVENTLRFNKRLESKSGEIIRQKMYPCYGEDNYIKNINQWYLSVGYLDNSVILYTPVDEDLRESENATFFEISEMYENIKLERFKLISIEEIISMNEQNSDISTNWENENSNDNYEDE